MIHPLNNSIGTTADNPAPSTAIPSPPLSNEERKSNDISGSPPNSIRTSEYGSPQQQLTLNDDSARKVHSPPPDMFSGIHDHSHLNHNNSPKGLVLNWSHKHGIKPKSSHSVLSPASTSHEPLSLAFLHKPRRSDELFEKESEKRKLQTNSLFNNTSPNERSVHNSSPNLTTVYQESVSRDDDSPHPKLIRKKSGELVKPSLKFSKSATDLPVRSVKSLPTTPTYKRQVHFGGDDSVDVRYFKKKDKPAAISASNSPNLEPHERKGFNWRLNDDDDEEDEDDSDDLTQFSRLDLAIASNTFAQWTMETPNFVQTPLEEKIKLGMPVFLERIFVSIDKKFIIGQIAVKNLAFEKWVTARYSLDNWETVIEVPSVFVTDIPRALRRANYDRFVFKLPLINIINSFQLNYVGNDQIIDFKNNKCLSLCIRYNLVSEEYWDNNDLKNFEVKLHKKDPVKKLSQTKTMAPSSPGTRYSSKFLERRSSDSEIRPSDGTPKFLSDVKIQRSPETPRALKDYINNNPDELHLSNASNSFGYKPNFGSVFSTGASKSFGLSSPITDIDVSSTSDVQDISSNYSTRNTVNNNSSEVTPTRDFAMFATTNDKGTRGLDSKSYKELLDTYCFFKKPSTVSSILDVNNS